MPPFVLPRPSTAVGEGAAATPPPTSPSLASVDLVALAATLDAPSADCLSVGVQITLCAYCLANITAIGQLADEQVAAAGTNFPWVVGGGIFTRIAFQETRLGCPEQTRDDLNSVGVRKCWAPSREASDVRRAAEKTNASSRGWFLYWREAPECGAAVGGSRYLQEVYVANGYIISSRDVNHLASVWALGSAALFYAFRGRLQKEITPQVFQMIIGLQERLQPAVASSTRKAGYVVPWTLIGCFLPGRC